MHRADAAAKLMRFNAQDMAGALGAACAYAGGLAQFYKSGSVIKRVYAGEAAECGVISALLTQGGIWGPRDILEGKEAGFFRAFSDAPKPSRVTDDLEGSMADLRALLRTWPDLHDIEVSAPRLDDAFVALTTDHPDSQEDVR